MVLHFHLISFSEGWQICIYVCQTGQEMMVTLNLHTRTDFPNLARVSSMNIWDCSLVLCVFRTMFSCAFSMPFKITGLLPGLFQHSYLQAASQLSPLTIAVDICLDPLTQRKRETFIWHLIQSFFIYMYIKYKDTTWQEIFKFLFSFMLSFLSIIQPALFMCTVLVSFKLKPLGWILQNLPI